MPNLRTLPPPAARTTEAKQIWEIVQTEQINSEAIYRLHGELTVVVIAHRLSTVRKADSIIVLNRGEIVEQGTWQALLSRRGSIFAGMVQAGASS